MINLKTKNWEIKNVDTILFDKDGTIIDLHFFWGKMTELRCKEIIRRFHLDDSVFEILCAFLGYDVNAEKMLSDGITALYSRSKIVEIFKENLSDVGVSVSKLELVQIFDEVSEIFYKNMIDYTKPIVAAIDFIKKVRSLGLKLGIVTSDSIVSTNLTLKHFGWSSFFDTVVGRENSTETKESGALTKIALENLNANPKKTLMIGDAPMDFWAAKNANVENSILVTTGQVSKNELSAISPCVINSLSELKIVNKSIL